MARRRPSRCRVPRSPFPPVHSCPVQPPFRFNPAPVRAAPTDAPALRPPPPPRTACPSTRPWSSSPSRCQRPASSRSCRCGRARATPAVAPPGVTQCRPLRHAPCSTPPRSAAPRRPPSGRPGAAAAPGPPPQPRQAPTGAPPLRAPPPNTPRPAALSSPRPTPLGGGTTPQRRLPRTWSSQTPSCHGGSLFWGG